MKEGNVKRRVGWRPNGSRKAIEYSVAEVEGATWCRVGNEKSVGSARVNRYWHDGIRHILGLSSPTTTKKPANESSSC